MAYNRPSTAMTTTHHDDPTCTHDSLYIIGVHIRPTPAESDRKNRPNWCIFDAESSILLSLSTVLLASIDHMSLYVCDLIDIP